MTQLLRHLVRVAETAGREVPALAGKFKLPPQNRSHKSFLTAASLMVNDATRNRELLAKYGLSEALFAELAQAVGQYAEATVTAHTAKQDRIGARADMAAVTDELVQLVQVIDGICRYRFRDQPDLLAAWDNVTDILGPFRSKRTDPETPPEGGLPSA